MENIDRNSIEHFVFDKSFREWVLNPATAGAHWEQWLQEHPEQHHTLQYAKAVIYALQLHQRPLPEEAIQREIEKILSQLDETGDIFTEEDLPAEPQPRRSLFRTPWWLNIAAVLLLIAGTSYLFITHRYQRNITDAFFSSASGKLIQSFNHTGAIQRITLPDASTVYLENNSKLSYHDNFNDKKREVYLEGEAFFEVTKDIQKPFLVYSRNIVTKVLGTTFTVRAFPLDKQAMVVVKTGKVSVFKIENLTEANAASAELKGVVITPNQKIVYDGKAKELNKTLVDTPAFIAPPQATEFAFDDTPVKEVFKTMQRAYGITILYDEELLSSCSLSVTMGNESFYDKLTLICKAINASYEVIDGNIIISAKGCK
ncbi:anti-FecI sigma factor, FecR [Russula earlei]|uniref:Anti-FecI sigma factor, FecR n=1 Tax=Russula earlei TaxID=71964 RepID=A0ACC0U5L8_9AGAM|nr:anti-FecI sigma factor, FecR [Russula earlei]